MLFLLLIILQLRNSLPLSLLPLYIHHPTSSCIVRDIHLPPLTLLISILSLWSLIVVYTIHDIHLPPSTSLISVLSSSSLVVVSTLRDIHLTPRPCWYPSPLSSLIVVSTLSDINLPSLLLYYPLSRPHFSSLIHDLYSSHFQQIVDCWVGWISTSTPSIMYSTPPPGPPPAG